MITTVVEGVRRSSRRAAAVQGPRGLDLQCVCCCRLPHTAHLRIRRIIRRNACLFPAFNELRCLFVLCSSPLYVHTYRTSSSPLKYLYLIDCKRSIRFMLAHTRTCTPPLPQPRTHACMHARARACVHACRTYHCTPTRMTCVST